MQKTWMVALFLAVFAVVLVRTAWVGDDAYITMRTVDNFVRGHGLRWNVAERVQAYTHPLWMLLIAPFYAATKDAYFTLVVLGAVLSFLSVGLVLSRLCGSWPAALVCGAALTLSKAFTDYSTSGLENPLSHLMIACFALAFFSGWRDARTLFVLSVCLSLALLTRLDLAPLLAPPFAWRLWQVFRSKTATRREIVASVGGGLLPLAAWEVFSVVYYGFPFPNTAYAKLNTGIPRSDLIRQGLCYLMDSVRVDPVTLLVVALGIVVGLKGAGDYKALAAGIILSLVYVVNVGGDFMTGRFLTPAFFCAVALLTHAEWPANAAVVVAAVIGVLGVVMPKSPVRSAADYEDRHFWSYNGIADERGMFYRYSGLLRYSRESGEIPTDPHMEAGRQARYEAEASGRPMVLVHPDGTVGFYGYAAGPLVHIVDPFALADPLLARMISHGHVVRQWRIGHFARSVPPGYLETLRTGRNQLENPDLARFYDKLVLVTRGPLWSAERFGTILAINLGRYNKWLKGKVIFGAPDFAHRTGERKMDPSARSDSLLVADSGRHGEGYLAFGNYMVLQRGSYKARFRLRATGADSEPVARLDVAGDRGASVLAERLVRARDCEGGGAWTVLELPFEISKKRLKDVEFRVYYLGAGTLEFDNATLCW